MQVLGLNGSHDYIAVVTHDELDKVMKRTYSTSLARLKVGEAFDLGQGYRFHAEIVEGCRQMSSAVDRFNAAKSTMMSFALMISTHAEQVSRIEAQRDEALKALDKIADMGLVGRAEPSSIGDLAKRAAEHIRTPVVTP